MLIKNYEDELFMKMNFLLVLLLSILLFSCAGQKHGVRMDVIDPNYEAQYLKFRNVPLHTSKDLDSFVKVFNNVRDSLYVKTINASENVPVKIFINTRGKIEHTYFYKEYDEKLKELIESSLEKAKFKKILSSNRFIDYSIIVTYRFYNGKILCPLINGVPFQEKSNCRENEKERVMNFFDVTIKPEIKKKFAPYYSPSDRKAGIQGTSVVTVTIDKNGEVEYAQIFKSLSNGLDHSSIDTAMKLKFKPASYEGKIVKVRMNIPYKFKLN